MEMVRSARRQRSPSAIIRARSRSAISMAMAMRTWRWPISARTRCGFIWGMAAAGVAAGMEAINIAMGDFNGDGRQDLVVANYASNNVSILLGNGDGTFSSAINVDRK